MSQLETKPVILLPHILVCSVEAFFLYNNCSFALKLQKYHVFLHDQFLLATTLFQEMREIMILLKDIFICVS